MTPAPKFPRALSVEQRGAVLRDYSHAVLARVIDTASTQAGSDPRALRAELVANGQSEEVRTLAEFHCGIAWLVERVEALEAKVHRLERGGGS